MIARSALLALLPVLAIAALTQRRRLAAIIGMGLFSFVLAATYLLLHAPDVAITEATIGAALVTAIYVLAIRRTGRLVVVADEAPGLLSREHEQIVGLEQEILQGFAHHLGLDLTIRVVPHEDVAGLLEAGEADIGAGGLVPTDDSALLSTPPHLSTALFAVSRESESPLGNRPVLCYSGYFSDLAERLRTGQPATVILDLARFLALSRWGLSFPASERLEGDHAYAMIVARGRDDLHRDLSDYVERLRRSGELDDLIARHVA
ncbi:hydrogenase subunit MbhD domain-containing protein [Candidatus Bipolaricaulota bacterium]